MKSKLFYIFVSIASLIAFQGCLMEEPEDIYKIEEVGGGSSGAGFYANTTSIEPGGTVYFTNTSNNRFDYFYWEFGDGNYSNDENPAHTYYEEGLYDVSLYAYSLAEDEEDIEIKYGYIDVSYGGGSNTYCESHGGTVDEYINYIFIEGWEFSSGDNNGYGDFTYETVNLNSGTSYYIYLQPGYNGSSFSEAWRVWIDFNQDGDFTDNGELIAEGTGVGAIDGDIYIPSNASGSTRMRVSMKYSSYAGPCDIFSYGEVEDYTVVINNLKDSQANDKPVNNTVKLKPINGDYTVKLK